jgi:hypothetical protein
VIDGDESHSEFIFTRFVLVGSFPACIGFIVVFYKTKKWGPFHTGGHRDSRICYSDVRLVGCLIGWFPACIGFIGFVIIL